MKLSEALANMEAAELRADHMPTTRQSYRAVNHPAKHVIRFPSDWLESVKERFAPSWIRDRWPVRFMEVTVSLEELYPGIEQSIPDRPAVMKIHVHRRDQFPVW